MIKTFFLRNQDIGRPIEEIKSLGHADRSLLTNIQRVMDKGIMDEREVRTENGAILLQRLHPYRNERGETEGVVMTYVDLSLVKHSEADRHRADLLRIAILDSLDANIVVLDRDGTIIAINKSWKEFAKQNESHDVQTLTIGSNYFAACDCSVDEAEYPDAQQALAGIQSVIEGRAPDFEMVYPCDAPNQKRHFLMRVTPLNHPDGGAVVAHINITERIKMEEELRAHRNRLDELVEARSRALKASEEKFRTLFDTMAQGVVYQSAEGHIIDANSAAERILGLSKDQMMGRTSMRKKRMKPKVSFSPI